MRCGRSSAPELASSVVPEYGEDAPRRAVGSVSVARVARVDDSHALVTVAAAATGGTRYLDGAGGAGCARRPGGVGSAVVGGAAGAGVGAGGAGGVVAGGRAGRDRGRRVAVPGAPTWRATPGALSYYVPAGVRIDALGQRHELVDVSSLALAAPAQGPRRVRCWRRSARRDAATGATYGLRYRLRLVREDRWLVAAVNTTRRQVEVMRKFVIGATVTVVRVGADGAGGAGAG